MTQKVNGSTVLLVATWLILIATSGGACHGEPADPVESEAAEEVVVDSVEDIENVPSGTRRVVVTSAIGADGFVQLAKKGVNEYECMGFTLDDAQLYALADTKLSVLTVGTMSMPEFKTIDKLRNSSLKELQIVTVTPKWTVDVFRGMCSIQGLRLLNVPVVGLTSRELSSSLEGSRIQQVVLRGVGYTAAELRDLKFPDTCTTIVLGGMKHLPENVMDILPMQAPLTHLYLGSDPSLSWKEGSVAALVERYELEEVMLCGVIPANDMTVLLKSKSLQRLTLVGKTPLRRSHFDAIKLGGCRELTLAGVTVVDSDSIGALQESGIEKLELFGLNVDVSDDVLDKLRLSMDVTVEVDIPEYLRDMYSAD
jgi:hypothetical protein